jgi:hypothetical protein
MNYGTSQCFISMQHKSRSRYRDGGDEKVQMAARTGYVLRFVSPGGTESASMAGAARKHRKRYLTSETCAMAAPSALGDAPVMAAGFPLHEF